MPLTQVDAGLLNTQAQYTGFKNRIINGAMMISQAAAGAAITPAGTGAVPANYAVDRFRIAYSQNSKLTAQQNAGSVTPPVGFKNYLGVSVASTATVGSTDYFLVGQAIEGLNLADLAWGTANAKSVTISFWVYSNTTGTFSGSINNSAYDRSYPFTYTINSATTWEYKTISIPGPTAGTWLTTNGVGAALWFSLGVGSSVSTTANAWASGAYYSATGATNLMGSTSNYLYITGVQFEVGSTATSFDYRPYGTELALCQRYYRIIGQGAISVARATTQVVHGSSYQDMRAAPTAALLTTSPVFYNFATGANTTGSGSTINDSSLGVAAAQVNLTGFSGLTAGQAMSAVTTAITSLSAEL